MSLLLASVLAALQASGGSKDDRERWLPPVKTVTLEAGERTAGEVLESIRKQTGLPVEASGVDGTRRVSLEIKERPVLEALDALCRALGKGGVKATREGEGPATIEVDGDAPLPPASAHWRQFRV